MALVSLRLRIEPILCIVGNFSNLYVDYPPPLSKPQAGKGTHNLGMFLLISIDQMYLLRSLRSTVKAAYGN